jgi:hypothetical protein
MIGGRRDRVEANAGLLLRARWLLDRIHLRLIILGDLDRARQVNKIIDTIDIERQRWLRTVDNSSL